MKVGYDDYFNKLLTSVLMLVRYCIRLSKQGQENITLPHIWLSPEKRMISWGIVLSKKCRQSHSLVVALAMRVKAGTSP